MYQKIITQVRPSVDVKWWWETDLGDPRLYTIVLTTEPGYLFHIYDVSDDELSCVSTIFFEEKAQWDDFDTAVNSDELKEENTNRIKYNIDNGITHTETENIL